MNVIKGNYVYGSLYMDYRMDKTVYAADQNKRFVMSNFTRSVGSKKRKYFFMVLLLFQFLFYNE